MDDYIRQMQKRRPGKLFPAVLGAAGSLITKKLQQRARDMALTVARRRRPKRGINRSSAGMYTGKFPFPNKKAKKDKSRVAYNGSQGTIEDNIEALTGQNVAYLGVSSIVKALDSTSTRVFIANPVYHFVVGILRKMFKKYYEVEIESVNQTLADMMFQGGDYTPTGLALYHIRTPLSTGTTGSDVAPVIDTVAGHNTLFYNAGPLYNITINNIALDIARKLMSNKEYGARVESYATDSYQLYGFAFLTKGGGGTDIINSGIYRLDNQKVAIRSTTTVYIQNQTTSDSGGTSYTVIDANPIKGRIFYFKDPNPIVRAIKSTATTETWKQFKLMADTNGDGLIYPDADPSENTGSLNSTAWAQLPGTDLFHNCSKYSSVSLAPGEMRKINLTFKFYGYINNYLKGLAINTKQYNTASPGMFQGTAGMYGNLGTSLLFAFDKRLSTGAGAVDIAVQRHVTTTVNIGKRTMRSMQPVKYGEVLAKIDDTT